MGKLIVIEGIDGIGKATALYNLSQYCKKYNVNHTIMMFPSYKNDVWNNLIKHYLKNAPLKPTYMESMILAMSYAGDRYQNKEKLQQALSNYDLVLLDRFVASNIAYQAAHFTDVNLQRQCCDCIHHMEHCQLRLPLPDLYILLYGSTMLAAKNLKQANKDLDSHECNLNYLKRVQKQYLNLVNKAAKTPWRSSRWVVVDVQDIKQKNIRDPQSIAQQIWQELQSIY